MTIVQSPLLLEMKDLPLEKYLGKTLTTRFINKCEKNDFKLLGEFLANTKDDLINNFSGINQVTLERFENLLTQEFPGQNIKFPEQTFTSEKAGLISRITWDDKFLVKLDDKMDIEARKKALALAYNINFEPEQETLLTITIKMPFSGAVTADTQNILKQKLTDVLPEIFKEATRKEITDNNITIDLTNEPK